LRYQQEIHNDVCFYGQNDQEICCFPIDVVCNHLPPGDLGTTPRENSGGFIYDDITNKVLITNFQINPNPSSGIIYVMFDLWENSFVEIEVFNNLGNKVKTIFSGELKKNSNNNYMSELQDLSNGHYIVKISCNGLVNKYPFILIK